MFGTKRAKRLGVAVGVSAASLALLSAGLPYGPLDFLQIANAGYYTTSTPTPTPASTSSSSSSSGGGGGSSTPAVATTLLAGGTAAVPIPASALSSATAPVSVTTTLTATGGGTVLAGNMGISFPAAAFSGITGNVSVSITAAPPTSAINAGGPSQFSPNGTIVNIAITDSSGHQITTFPVPVAIEFSPNASDLGMAHGNPSLLTAGYVIDDNSPEIENPNHYPINTLVVAPPSATTFDPATNLIVFNTQAIGSIMGVITNPVGYVQTLSQNAPELSSFASNATTFSTKPQFSYLQVVEPQIGTRLMVLDPDTGNYSYVNATDVGPSGPPPAKTAAGVVRGLLSDS